MTEPSPPYLCPACGYDIDPLEGIDRLTCPECGEMTTRMEAASRIEARTARAFYTVSSALLIGPTLIPNAILLADTVTPADLSGAFGLAWMICVPLCLPILLVVVFLAYRRSDWRFRRRIRPRVLWLIVLVAMFSGGGWYVLYALARWATP